MRVDLYQQGYAPTLVLTGGDGRIFDTGPQEAVEMKRWAVRLGVPESATMIDTEARNTYENATGTKRLLGPASIFLVSSASHLPRAVPVFTKQGFRVTPAPAIMSHRTCRERAGTTLVRLISCQRIPRYNRPGKQ